MKLDLRILDEEKAALDSPDQGSYDIPVDSISFGGKTLEFSCNKLKVNDTGRGDGGCNIRRHPNNTFIRN